MTKNEFDALITPLMDRYRNAVRHRCKLTANARMRDMAKIYARYRGIEYDEAMSKLKQKLLIAK